MTFEAALCIYKNGAVGRYSLAENDAAMSLLMSECGIGKIIVTDYWDPINFPMAGRKHIVCCEKCDKNYTSQFLPDATFATVSELKLMTGNFCIISVDIIREFILSGLIRTMHIALSKFDPPPNTNKIPLNFKIQHNCFQFENKVKFRINKKSSSSMREYFQLQFINSEDLKTVHILQSLSFPKLPLGHKASIGYLSQEFDISDCVPFMNLKSINLDEIIKETVLFFEGKLLVFSRRWRHCATNYGGIVKQIQNTVEKLNKKLTTRHVISFIDAEAQKTTDISTFHIMVREDKLDMVVSQIKCNLVVDGPSYIVQLSIFLYIFAHYANLKPGTLVWNCSEAFTDAAGARSVQQLLKNYVSTNFPRLIIDKPQNVPLSPEHIKVLKN